PEEVRALAAQVAADQGAVLATYREPFGGTWVLLVALPIDRVAPTPYQRELSKPHVDRLGEAISKLRSFLDPGIAVRPAQGYWTPNGMHRLEALRSLGGKAIVALLLADPDLAYRILALNTEKAHTLKDKSLEVVRMVRGMVAEPSTRARPESSFAFELEE